MKTKWICALAVMLSVGAGAFGQEKKPAGKSYVLKATRLFDGKSNTLVKPGVVVVTDGKIVAAGTSAAIPAGAETIDLGDATLLPGFIDAHTHLTMSYREDYARAALDSLQKPIPGMALDASVNGGATLMAGITTVRGVGTQEYGESRLSRAHN